jgi:hypothetical protein
MPRVINKIDDHYVDRRKIDNLLRAMFKPDECELRVRRPFLTAESRPNQISSGGRTNGSSKLLTDCPRYVHQQHVPDEIQAVVLCLANS